MDPKALDKLAHGVTDEAAKAYIERLEVENETLKTALAFYSDPGTYFAIGFFPDPPCGEFVDDFSETELGMKPGKRARDALGDG